MRGVVLRCYSTVFGADITVQDGQTTRVILAYAELASDQRDQVVPGAWFTWTAHEQAGTLRTIGLQFDGAGR
jgi:hypothetical protein